MFLEVGFYIAAVCSMQAADVVFFINLSVGNYKYWI